MCWMCDKLGLYANLTSDPRGSLGFLPSLGLESGALTIGINEVTGFESDAALQYRMTDGLIGTGHSLVPPQIGALIITVDNVAGDTSTSSTISVGQSLISTIDTIGDQDFFKVELVAGKTYEIGQYLTTSGPNAVPLADAYIELYDATGKLIVVADGGGPNTPSGLDALLTYTASYSGTYYINARAYDQEPLNGTTGDFVGDYELFVREPSPFAYRPYYDVDSPLYALDWGSQVDGSSRNPDGQEGPRPTGNPFTGHAWNPYGIEGKNIIYYYFAKQGEVYVSEDPANPGLENMVAAGFRDWEKNAYELALGEYEKVADIVYIEVENRNEADFIFITYDGTPNVGVLGRMSPPDEQNEGQTEFNRNGPGWNEQALKPGGFSFQTLMHELGHGHGMAHPHDGGGRSGILRGVFEEAPFDHSVGDYSLNQGIYTIMSYEDGWRPRSEATSDTNGDGINDTEGLRPDGHGAPPTSSSYGWVGSLSAFDIAVIQDKYGVNEDWATGNDTYVLKDANVDGTFYQTIWDAGGVDSIVYSGARDATIDLRAATLRYEFGGGGRMSYAFGIHGGFTIANGVTIENAFGGAGNDRITGNAAANVLIGNAGNDVIDGGLGADIIAGGDGDDTLIGGSGEANEMVGGAGNDTYVVSVAGDTLVETAGGGIDTVQTTLASYTLKAEFENLSNIGTGAFTGTGNAHDNIMIGNAGRDILFGLEGADYLVGQGGDDSLFGGAGANTLQGGTGDDTYYVVNAGDTIIEQAGEGNDAVVTTLNYYALGANLETLIFNGSGDFAGVGNAAANRIEGGHGNDLLNGGLGADVLVGHGGADDFLFDSALGGGNIDTLPDFLVGTDRIFLEDSVFTGLATGMLAAGAFATGSAATEADDRIIYDAATGALYFDADGVGGAAAIQFAQLNPGLDLTAASFAVI